MKYGANLVFACRLGTLEKKSAEQSFLMELKHIMLDNFENVRVGTNELFNVCNVCVPVRGFRSTTASLAFNRRASVINTMTIFFTVLSYSVGTQ